MARRKMPPTETTGRAKWGSLKGKHGTMTMYINGSCRCEECKKCNRDYKTIQHCEYRQWIDTLKIETGCIDCKYNSCAAALQFDHIDPENKSFGIATATTKSINKVLIEIEKCEIRCVNCHAIKTHGCVATSQNYKPYHIKIRSEINDFKTELGCIDCGYNECPTALQFDHLDKNDKLFNIGRAVGRLKAQVIWNEIFKCEVRCGNCHAEKTWKIIK